jgi:hypothetical protein
MSESEQSATDASKPWQVESLRLSWILATGAVGDKSGQWWRALAGDADVTHVSQSKTGTSQDEGIVAGKKLIIAQSPGRVDLVQTGPDITPETFDNSPVNLLPYPESINAFRSLISKWLSLAPQAVRVAFGVVLLKRAADADAGLAALLQYFPSFKVRPNATDFYLQINRPQKSHVLDDVPINRLTKLSVASYMQILASGMGGDVQQSRQQTLHFARLELDVNNAISLQGPLPKEKAGEVVDELVLAARKIIDKEDIE